MTELAKSTKQIAGLVTDIVSQPLSKVKMNKKRHRQIVRLLYEAKIKGKGLYSTVTMEKFAPQTKYYPGSPSSQKVVSENHQHDDFFLEHVPVKDSLTADVLVEVVLPGTLLHRRWLWFATMTDRREISERVYYTHCKIYEDYPGFYNEDVLEVSRGNFRLALKNRRYKIGSPAQSVEYWLICAKTLYEEFDGDPVNLLAYAGWSVEEVYAWKQKERKLRGYDPIPGWGRKLISLYFLYLAELGYRLPEDAFPADVHAQAILLQTGVVNFGSRDTISSSSLAELVRASTTEICLEKKYDVVEFAHADWLLGSQLCTKCSSRSEVPFLCPIYNECKGRVDTSLYFAKGLWMKDGQVMTKGGVRPGYGLPTEITRRFRSRKQTREPDLTISLFG